MEINSFRWSQSGNLKLLQLNSGLQE